MKNSQKSKQHNVIKSPKKNIFVTENPTHQNSSNRNPKGKISPESTTHACIQKIVPFSLSRIFLYRIWHTQLTFLPSMQKKKKSRINDICSLTAKKLKKSSDLQIFHAIPTCFVGRASGIHGSLSMTHLDNSAVNSRNLVASNHNSKLLAKSGWGARLNKT